MRTLSSEDWTFARYVDLLDMAGEGRRFEPFGTAYTGAQVLWRHDIDYSIAHAAKLARMEADRNVRATYFVMLGSPYYNLLEPDSMHHLREIRRLGHWIGLHFDPERYTLFEAEPDLERAMRREQAVLADVSGDEIQCVSLHNPAFAGLLHMDAERLGGMVNAYSAGLRKSHTYCSDSFGYWRYTPIHDVIRDPKNTKMQVLTHPIWWWEMPFGSRARIRACVEEHAQRLFAIHDDLLSRAGQLDAVVEADRARGYFDPPTP